MTFLLLATIADALAEAPSRAGLSSRDVLAMACALVGVVAQILQRRLPAGLGPSVFVAGATLAGAIVVFDRFAGAWPVDLLAIVFSAAVSLFCVGVGAAAALGEASRRRNERHPPSDVFFMWGLLAGATAAALIGYFLAVQTGQRIFSVSGWREPAVPISGLPAALVLLAAVLTWRQVHARPEQPAMLLALGALAAWWSAMLIPGWRGGAAETGLARMLPAWWTWVFQLKAGLAALLAAAAMVQDQRYRARLAGAWPDRLNDLVQSYSRWPAYIQLESILAAAVLLLGVFQIVRREAPSASLFAAGSAATGLAGYTCLFMTYRRWSANTAGLGMALVTAAIVLAAAAVATWLLPDALTAQYAHRMPALYNAILLALVVMAALWRWLAAVWDQQLLGGVAWTTTGRMIPYAKRTAFFLLALAALVAFQMALWPRRIVSVTDDGPWRWIAGIGVLTLLAAISALAARRDGSPALASLSVLFVAVAIVFAFVRWPASSVRGWLVQYDAVVFSLAALPMLGLAEALPATRWRAFAVPLWFAALLILPAAALAELLGPSLPEAWVRPLTLAILGAVYALAGSRESRRAFLVLGGVLLVAAVTTLCRAYGAVLFSS